MNQREYIVTPPLAREVEYEYAVQWYHDSRNDSLVRNGWHDGSWTTIDLAKFERDSMLSGIWKPEDVRLVRRIKAGPIEVVEDA